MADRLSPERRSALMARVGPKNTKPEMAVRRLLHAAGWRFRLHRKGLPGTPDIVFGPLKAAIFVHGCFWHGHTCRRGRLPQTRTEFWAEKIEGNRARDAKKIAELVGLGWRVMVVWQCCLGDSETLSRELEDFLRGNVQVAASKTSTQGGSING